MSTAVRFEDVSKKFILHHQKARSFQDLIVNFYKRNGSKEEFWALSNVSFEVSRGETLGIIGRNGSGKSTVLKLMSRILEPTSGKVTVFGKISALLELGAGFHPDLSGKENIFLNGSLLGLSRKEMSRKYEEIVEFSEIRHFIDTPVKHYSSGMYMRLGFSIAISVEPDILIADEILAVGDSGFVRKCLRRMYELKRMNKTIVIVSHDAQAVRDMCDRALWLSEGRVRATDKAGRTLDTYLIEVDQESAQRSTSLVSSAAVTPPPVGSAEVSTGSLTSESSAHRWGSFEATISS
ncbi:MAG: ABC transporter ATP-binding protein, partial [Dehalococcoidia bacterium]|nr:ABC transporter ATP-binding protein [Dehalococcoidia bacterium]